MQRRKKAAEPGTYTGQIIDKSVSPGEGALFFRLSMGDYMIQCSGTEISEDSLRARVDEYVTVKGEIRTGRAESFAETGDFMQVTGLVD